MNACLFMMLRRLRGLGTSIALCGLAWLVGCQPPFGPQQDRIAPPPAVDPADAAARRFEQTTEVSYRATLAAASRFADCFEAAADRCAGPNPPGEAELADWLSQQLKQSREAAFAPVDRELAAIRRGGTWDPAAAVPVLRAIARGHRRVR